MNNKERGLYEVLISEQIDADLRTLEKRLHAQRGQLRSVDAADRIALHVARILNRAVAHLDDDERVKLGIALARRLVEQIDTSIDGLNMKDHAPTEAGEVLRAIVEHLPDGTPESILEPMIPLLDTTLLTNAPGDPTVGSQLEREIYSADRIDVVIAFIRVSGIRPMLPALRSHCQHGRTLRILTTTYTGSTEARALNLLRDAGAEVRVSYDTSTTRLHAKAWLFDRRSGFSTAYIGSSNLTHSAQRNGLEWNVRASSARNPDVVAKMAAVFEGYWNSGDFVPYDEAEFDAHLKASERSGPALLISPIELRPEPFQERLLEQIAVSRQLGHHRNLLVSATGTGKTVMAAIDYSRLQPELPRSRLLFVAHRKEILQQSIDTFRHCLRSHSFGERWVDGHRPSEFQHVFASIQSLSATSLRDLSPEHFDVVIIDEFHHAGAATYRALLEHLKPKELLALTATPERSDGLPLLHWFDNRIAAELRLWDAIDQHRLSPFEYYGIHDGLDLRAVPWIRGRGYDVAELTNLFTANEAWARQVLTQLADHVNDIHQVRALGFCVSVEHARFMAYVFQKAEVPSVAIWADSPHTERVNALSDLAARRVNAVFSVDLFNEGIDIPVVDTLLMLRPTESPVLFLQQLGRGLRRSPGKVACTVLDFVGTHRKEFRFDRRFQALLGGTRVEVTRQIERGFPFLPAGCHMQLDKVSTEIVLSSIRSAIPSRWSAKVEELRKLSSVESPVNLQRYLEETGLDIADVYANNKSWSDLQSEAEIPLAPAGPNESALRKGCGRLLHVDDLVRIDTYRTFLKDRLSPETGSLSARQTRLLRMLVSSLAESVLTPIASLDDACRKLWSHEQVRFEVIDLLDVLSSRIDHIHREIAEDTDVPLQIHARYSRREILAAFGVGAAALPPPWREGVYWVEDDGADLFAFTLDKTGGDFSPTTRYKDYAISPSLIHWESQSRTRAVSETGLRYQNHQMRGSSVMLFGRLRSDDRAFWFLGPATYVKHESEMPMAITWKLKHPLPGDLFAQFAAAVA